MPKPSATITFRAPDEVGAQLTHLSKLTGRTVSDLLRLAVDGFLMKENAQRLLAMDEADYYKWRLASLNQGKDSMDGLTLG